MSPLRLLPLAWLLSAPALAASLTVEVELPTIDVADYRRPYVSVWLERPDHSVAANLLVWYDVKMRDHEGSKWLKDMRQWWRRSGRNLNLPIDGISSATRLPGQHTLTFTAGESPLNDLSAGDYTLIVEAAREHGGRELLSLPLQWPPAENTLSEAHGKHELGRIAMQLNP